MDDLFVDGEPVIMSSISLMELERIKTSANRDSEIKYAARKLIALLEKHTGEYEVIPFTQNMLDRLLVKYALPNTNDMCILATAVYYDIMYHPDETIFVTNDLSLKHIANLFFGEDSIISVEDNDNDYSGYKEITMTDEEMAEFYNNQCDNKYDLLTNEYIIIRNQDNELTDILRWNGEMFEHLSVSSFSSPYFGNITAYGKDPYQKCAVDSLLRNKITVLKGKAGSGKTTLALGYLFSELFRGHIDKVIIFCNTVATKDAARLGYYPGEKDQKLLDSQLGNLLSSKFGGLDPVRKMIDNESLVLLPLSDVRGYDTSGMRAGVYISEAQNLSVSLLKLALQRIGEDSICIIDGDNKQQLDMSIYEGSNNGMRRMSEVFKGSDFYGEVELQTIHRSKIAEKAQLM